MEKVDIPGRGRVLSQPAHSLPYEVVLKELRTQIDDGLTPDEAARRLQTYGPNKLEEGEGVSVAKILVRQVANAMMLVKGPTLRCFFQLSLVKELI
jgi:Na+-exporting ATPase